MRSAYKRCWFSLRILEKKDGTSLLHQATHERAVEGCILLLEGTVDYEIDRFLVDPMYRGDESFVTSEFEAIVRSHESPNRSCGMLVISFGAVAR